MSLAAINSQYNGLNGLYGYSTYGSSLYSDTYVEDAKTGIANSYEVSATSSSYANKSSVSSSSFSQQCQAIQYLLQEGRTEDAMDKYDDLYEDMASNSYYEGYTENEIKTLLQEKYLDATGTTLVSDIEESSKSSFSTGFLGSIPLIGGLFQTSSEDEFIAEATGTEESTSSKVGTIAGATVGALGSAAVGAAIGTAICPVVGTAIGAAVGGVGSILTSVIGKATKDSED